MASKNQKANHFNGSESSCDALIQVGIEAYQSGQFNKAFSYFQNALLLQPKHDRVLFLLGATYNHLNQHDEAIATLEAAIQVNPCEAQYYCHLGNAHFARGDVQKAIASFQKSIQTQADYVDARFNLGNVFLDQKCFHEAVDAYQKAVHLDPENTAIYNNLGHAFHGLEKYDEAIAQFQKILTLKPGDIDARKHIGNALQQQEKYTEALEIYEALLAEDPNNAGVYNNIANTLQKTAQFEASLTAYRKAIALEPQSASTHLNYALGLLLNGKFQEGWQEHEWRLLVSKVVPNSLQTEPWQGEPLANQEILLWSEQGLGDSIQFIRYALLLQQQGYQVTVATRASLLELFRTSLSPKIKVISQDSEDLSNYQNHVSLMSLPWIFQTDLHSIPNQIPYLRSPAQIPEHLQLPQSSATKIGLVWAGGKINPILYKSKSIHLEDFFQGRQDLLTSGNYSFWSLQVGEDAAQIEPWLAFDSVFDLSHKLQNFADTASVIQQLDLVITVDTAVAHLAGAMSKPVWLMLPFVPDWRWLLERDDCPWYPGMRLFRQPALGDWESVFDNVRAALLEFVPVTDTQPVKTVPQQPLPRPKAGSQSQTNQRQTLHQRGEQLQRTGQLTAAIAVYQELLTLEPNPLETYNTLGNLFHRTNQLDQATTMFQAAVKQAPNAPGLQYNLGNAYLLQEKYDQAIACYDKALQLDPQDRNTWNNRGHAFMGLKQYDQAVASFQAILEFIPDDADSFSHIGTALQEQGKGPEAIQKLRYALQLKPDSIAIKYNLANLLQRNGFFLESIQFYREILQQAPEHKDANFNLGWVLLLIGELQEGWNHYEYRFSPQDLSNRLLPTPMWQGEALQNKPLLLWSEQGFGDAIQFVRYVALCVDRGIDVILGTRNSLKRLFQKCLNVTVNVIDQDQLQGIDPNIHHCPLMSLPYIFQSTETSIPQTIPYLTVPDISDSLILPRTKGKKIGLVWGSKIENQQMYRSKAIQLQEFIPVFQDLLDTEQITLWSLQVGEDAAQVQPFLSHSGIFDLSSIITDFYDTAAIITQLDLVITIDTAVAHLAGALGKSVWVMLPHIPDWRWQLEREDSPWYPTMRLFRQGIAGDWQGVFGQIYAALVGELILEALSGTASVTHQENPDKKPTVFTNAGSVTPPKINSSQEVTSYRSLAESFRAARDFEQAIAMYQKAIEVEPNNPELHNDLGNLFYEIKSYLEAEKQFQEALSLEPENANLCFNLGNTFLMQAKYREAIVNYQKALQSKPDHDGAVNNICYLSNQVSDTKILVEALYSFIENKISQIQIYKEYGKILKANGATQQAILAFKQAMIVDPENNEIKTFLAQCLIENNNMGEALSSSSQPSQKNLFDTDVQVASIENLQRKKGNQKKSQFTEKIIQDIPIYLRDSQLQLAHISKSSTKTIIHLISHFRGHPELGHTGYNIHAFNFAKALDSLCCDGDTQVLVSDLLNQEEMTNHCQYLQQSQCSIINIFIGMGYDCWEKLQPFPGIKIAYTVWESTKLPDSWVPNLNHCDYVWTASHWGKTVLIKNGIKPEKTFVVPEGVNGNLFHPELPADPTLENDGKFKFFTVGKCEPRKSTAELIKAFDLEFHADPDVYLVLACDNVFVHQFNMQAFVENLWLRNYHKFIYISRKSDYADVAKIVNACHCGVFPTKAEGWGLPIIESMALGKPTIATNYSAVTEYANENNAILLDYFDVPIQDVDLFFNRMDGDYGTWAMPKTQDLRRKMRAVYQNYSHYQQKAIASSAQVRQDWSWQAAAYKALNVIQSILSY
ncbi:hypothetical protein AWQ24_11840 [Picosynechococcus sp. PCC 8807]|nr:hypothetical protein AWQ24_11840 [Picosynechococcus sp. PCC 8807]